jgi:hypothetical protein
MKRLAGVPRQSRCGQFGGTDGRAGAGMLGDAGKFLASPFRQAMDQSGRPTTDTPTREALAFGKRWSPNVWYSKLAVDRLLWDKLNVLVDPNYRQSLYPRRAKP